MLQVTSTDGKVKAKVQGDAAQIIDAIIDCMNNDSTFRSIVGIAAATCV